MYSDSIMGCKTKLNRVLIKTIVELVWLGYYESEIRQQINVTKSTSDDWKRRGEAEKRGIFHEFSTKFDRTLTQYSLYKANNADVMYAA